jgi:hypothetical protein
MDSPAGVQHILGTFSIVKLKDVQTLNIIGRKLRAGTSDRIARLSTMVFESRKERSIYGELLR